MKTFKLALLSVLFFAFTGLVKAQHITILHTNDIHSRITGDGPEKDYSPEITNNDEVIGGFARLATLLKDEKAKNPNGTLVLDAGDFLMGTLFNVNEPYTGFQLAMMKKMGFQYTTIGNHEFDYGPNKLADVINEAKKHGGIPQIISSNLVPDPNSPKDDKLAKLFEDKTILPYEIIDVEGVKIGMFGILGVDAAEDAPLKTPVQVENQIKTAKAMVQLLRKEKHVDMVIMLSHSGEYPDGKGGFEGEDVKLAKKVKGIDIIISGHTHVVVPQPYKVKNTLIVQTGAYLHYLGKLDLDVKNGKIADFKYKLIPIDDKIMGNQELTDEINQYEKVISKKYLQPYGLNWGEPVAETSFNLMKRNKKGYQFTNLGPFIDHAIRTYVDEDGGGTDVTLLASGTVRDNILKGKTGVITPPDVFRVMSLGMANDTLPGYPLARIYLTGHELKGLMNVLLLSNTDDGYVFISGMKAYYNPKKLMLTRIKRIDVDGKQINTSKKDKKLYSVTANTYLLSFIGRVKKLSHGLVNVVPKNKDGQPIKDINNALIDFDKNKPGIQEGSEWLGVIRYMQKLKDTNSNGIPDIPLKYKPDHSNRIVITKKK
ncbi:MAG: bifunctional metallophosphatase/5'-nucleotidase [Bacteroidales bacterium]|nr:bifunctional metallophosphatase/5'-nucleotidase [Bacteroidales bacterium]